MFWNGRTAEALALARQAMDKANSADSRQDAHERLCSERWEQLRSSIDKIAAAFETKHAENKASLAKLWWAILVGVSVLGLDFGGKYLEIIARAQH